MMENNFYTVYVKTNEFGYIMSINSSVFLDDTSGWVEIDSGEGDKYYHAQHHYLPEPIMTATMVYRYKLVDDIPIECTAAEIAAQEALLPKLEDSNSLLSVYDELEAAYQEGVNSI